MLTASVTGLDDSRGTPNPAEAEAWIAGSPLLEVSLDG